MIRRRARDERKRRRAGRIDFARVLLWAALASLVLQGTDALAEVPESGLPQKLEKGDAPTSASDPSSTASDPTDGVTPVTSYVIDARLDSNNWSLTGTARVTLFNHSSAALDAVYFHLYLNAFEHPRTLFMRTGGGRSGRWLGRPGRMIVTALRMNGHDQNLWKNAAPHSPGDPDDRTDIRVPLPRRLAPGATAHFDLEFRADFPELVERTGVHRDFLLAAQWFPKLAKLEPDGSWAHFAFHPYGEFYADFGSYDVTLHVPKRFVVGATGPLRQVATSEAWSTYRSSLDAVHDFAWTAWPHFEVEERVLEQDCGERRAREPDCEPVKVRLLAPNQVPESRRRTWETLEAGLPFLSRAFGPYPYETLTVVHPPKSAARAGGMEYPTFITTGGSELLAQLGVRIVELVTIHELAHQWFQGMVASDEHAAPFLDEGLTAYAEWVYLERRYGDGSLLEFPGLQVSRVAASRASFFSQRAVEPINQPSSDYATFLSLANVVYNGAPLTLGSIAGTSTEQRLVQTLGDYARGARFSHPSPRVFFQFLEEELGQPLGMSMKKTFSRVPTFDAGIEETRLVRDGHDAQLGVTVFHRGRGRPRDALLRVRWADGRESETRVALTHDGEAQIPLLESRECERWSNCLPAVVELDPHHQLLLDSNWQNNRKEVSEARAISERRTRAPSFLLQLTWWVAWLLS